MKTVYLYVIIVFCCVNSRLTLAEGLITVPASTAGFIRTVPLESASVAKNAVGIASIFNPDALLQINADILVATAAVTQSQTILKRDQAMYDEDQSISLQELESAKQQAASDSVQLDLLNQRLVTTWGGSAPFIQSDKRKQLIDELSAGNISLGRVDFSSAVSASLHDIQLISMHSGNVVRARDSWPAPVKNPVLPGSSYFVIVPGATEWQPGAILKASADLDTALQGVIIPASAIVLDEGQAWCYLQKDQENYERHAVPLDRPLSGGGYLVSEGYTAETLVVIQGAGLLLSIETEAPEEE